MFTLLKHVKLACYKLLVCFPSSTNVPQLITWHNQCVLVKVTQLVHNWLGGLTLED